MKKRILASLLSLCLIVGLLPTAALAADVDDLSGYCGSDTSSTSYTFQDSKGKTYTVYENLTWKLKKNDDQSSYTLSISGNGPMSDKVQWRMDANFADYADQISVVQIDIGVTSIASGAFREMDALTDIFIPETVSSIADWSFYDSPIENLVISQDNTAYVTDSEGVLYTSDMETLVYYPKTRQGAYKLPATVTKIGPSAFMNSNLTALDMSEAVNLTTMPHQMLTNTKISDTLSIPENITTFSTYSCAELKNALVRIGASSITVEAYAFSKTNAVDFSKVTQITHKPGWNSGAYYEGGCQVFVDNQAVLTALTADENFNGYPIIFYLNHGTVQDDRSVVKDGYTFGGWYENPDYSDGALTGDPQTGKTYYAKWVSEITFDANGGEGSMTAQQVTEGDKTTTLTANTFTKTGYTFNGWNTQADGKGTSYEDQDTVPTTSTTLYAQWTPNTYTIQFDANGGTGTMDNIEATYDSVVKLPANGFTKADHKFAGWAKTSSADDGSIDFSDQTEVLNLAASGTVTLYAVWTDKNVREPDLSDTVVTYNGQPQKFHVDDNYTVKYYQNREEVTDPTNAGIYDVEITRAEDDDYAAYHGRVMGGLVINKAPLTIKADDQSIRAGGTLPKFTYTVTGLAGEDPLLKTPVLTCDADGKTVGTYAIKASGADAGANYTITYVDGTLTVSKRSSGGGSSGSSGSTTTETEKNPDGSTTTTVIDKKTGTVTETTKYKDGSTLVVETQKDGTVTTTETAKNGVKVSTVDEPGEDVTAKITVPKSVGEAVVTIPADVDYGMVAVDADTGEVVKLSVPTEDGMTVKLDGSAELVLVDRSRGFTDTRGHWAEDAIDFAAAHELFSGTGDAAFTPDSPMTRAMLMTVLARFDGQEITGGAVWYEKAMAWAKENGISDGSDPDGSITREQLATMLWRYAGSPIGDGSLSAFGDSASVNGYAVEALRWAVGEGLISGTDGGLLAPQGSATRAQVATILMRFVESLTK